MKQGILSRNFFVILQLIRPGQKYEMIVLPGQILYRLSNIFHRQLFLEKENF